MPMRGDPLAIPDRSRRESDSKSMEKRDFDNAGPIIKLRILLKVYQNRELKSFSGGVSE